MNLISKVLLNAAVRSVLVLASQLLAQMPTAIAASDGAEIVTLHAEGAQIYECKPELGNKPEGQALTWQFREPVATLILDGKSVGRHYAGPNWDYADGSGVKGRVAASTPGTTSNDIPWLRIDAVDRRGSGVLSGVAAVRRVNTRGGVVQGPCEQAGDYLSVPYSADYVFLRSST
jgi:hypothetical protein